MCFHVSERLTSLIFEWNLEVVLFICFWKFDIITMESLNSLNQPLKMLTTSWCTRILKEQDRLRTRQGLCIAGTLSLCLHQKSLGSRTDTTSGDTPTSSWLRSLSSSLLQTRCWVWECRNWILSECRVCWTHWVKSISQEIYCRISPRVMLVYPQELFPGKIKPGALVRIFAGLIRGGIGCKFAGLRLPKTMQNPSVSESSCLNKWYTVCYYRTFFWLTIPNATPLKAVWYS